MSTEEKSHNVFRQAVLRERMVFQVRHPHYTPPFNDAVLRDAHLAARRAFAEEGQQYDRRKLWLSIGIDMDTLLATLSGDDAALRRALSPVT